MNPRAGTVSLMRRYKWRRIGVLADESVWADGTKNLFIKQLEEAIPGYEITNKGTMSFSHKAFRNGTITALELLQRLADTGTRVVYIITQPDIQRDIFEEVWRSKLLSGTGYAWISAWITEDSFYNKNQSGINDNAVRGAEGLLGFTEETKYSSPVTEAYISIWEKQASKQACDAEQQMLGPYCDQDGDPTTFAGRGPNSCDAVIAYATAIERLLQHGATEGSITGGQIYKELLAIGPFDGVSGDNVTLDSATGDRINGLVLRNIQLDSAEKPTVRWWSQMLKKTFG